MPERNVIIHNAKVPINSSLIREIILTPRIEDFCKMAHNLLSLDYFKAGIEDPFFGVCKILDDSSHSAYNDIVTDINNISETSLNEYIKTSNVSAHVARSHNKNFETRCHYLVYILQKQIQLDRIKLLSDKSNRPLPYNSHNLCPLNIDENNLIRTSDLTIGWAGFHFGEFAYQLTPCTPLSNSSYWLTMLIIRLTREKNITFGIRLDPLKEIHNSVFNPPHFLMTIHGRPLNWDRLKHLQDEEYGQWLNDEQIGQHTFTDYVWRPGKDGLHFTCEELPKQELLDVRGSRYFHAIFDVSTGLIKHCDGALRLYSDIEYAQRIKYHVRNSEVTKIGTRIKIFQTNDLIDQNTFALLATNFFVWNEDVKSYFNQKSNTIIAP